MLRLRPDGAVELDVHAVPRSSRDAIGKPHGDRLKLHVKAPPVDGSANAAMIKPLAKTLGVPRTAVRLLRGQSGKRKTLLAEGVELEAAAKALGLELPSPARPSTTLGALLLAGISSIAACESSRELPITVILPADTSDYSQANNASIVLRPSGDAFSFTVDGLDFALELEGDPDTSLQQLELYLANGEELLGWGTTAPFATAGADLGLALFLGRPGRLSTWPDLLDNPDPALLAAEAVGRGMLMVQADGDTFLLNHFTLLLEPGSRLPDTVSIPADDGGLYGAADGGILRLGFEQIDPLAWRYDPSSDTWSELSIDAAQDIGPRPGAAVLVDPDQSRLYLLGGGGQLDAIAIDLIPDDAGMLASAPVADFALDLARDHASAIWIATPTNPTADVLLVGGDSPGPIAQLGSAETSVGPDLDWRGLACAQREQTATAVHVLCVGGERDALASADALDIRVEDGLVTVEPITDFLPAALEAPLLFEDDTALYAQGAERWFRIGREDQDVSEPATGSARARGGHLVSLANNVTFLVGGTDQDGVALDRWQVFTPAIEP